MLQWLRKLLLRWLGGVPANSPPSRAIAVHHAGQVTTVHAERIAGLHIVCQLSEHGVSLISKAQAVDQEHFWCLWKYLGGDKATWADGAPYVP